MRSTLSSDRLPSSQKYGDVFELRGAGELSPELFGKLLGPALQMGVMLALECAVAVADEQVVSESFAQERHWPACTFLSQR